MNPEVERLVKLVASMSVDYLMGKGCTVEAYVNNLQFIAEDISEKAGLIEPVLDWSGIEVVELVRPFDDDDEGMNWNEEIKE